MGVAAIALCLSLSACPSFGSSTGETVTATTTTTGGNGNALSYAWYVDDILQSGATASSFSTALTGSTGDSHAIKVVVSNGVVMDDAYADFLISP
jgi:hypothetical protein